jgi:hypothetical protein
MPLSPIAPITGAARRPAEIYSPFPADIPAGRAFHALIEVIDQGQLIVDLKTAAQANFQAIATTRAFLLINLDKIARIADPLHTWKSLGFSYHLIPLHFSWQSIASGFESQQLHRQIKKQS